MPRTISEPLYSPATNIRAIAVHGVRGQHPADQAVWYLEHGYHVYDADSRLPLEYRARSSTGQKELVTVTHPLGHNVRTRLPQPEPHPFDLGQWPNVYSSQIREVDRVGHQWKDVTQSDRGAPQINIRRWPVSVNPNVTNRNRSLSIETANQETMEPAEVHCRDYLANLPAARDAVHRNRPLHFKVQETMNNQMRDKVLLDLVESSEGRNRVLDNRKMSASAPPDVYRYD